MDFLNLHLYISKCFAALLSPPLHSTANKHRCCV